MGKKKATGMSKRLGFTDRATIAENKEILRYNERLDREAKGLPPEAPRGGHDGRRPRAAGPDRGERPARAARPARTPRPVRPPALDDEQTAVLHEALAAAVGETGLEGAGTTVIERLAAHESFDRATAAGWEMAAGSGHAAERTESEWALLRKTWLGIRLALLEAYAQIKPDLAAVVERERKQLARIDRPRRTPRQRQAGERRNGQTDPRPERKPRRSPERSAPSPADVARVAAHPPGGSAGSDVEVADLASGAAGRTGPEPETADVLGAEREPQSVDPGASPPDASAQSGPAASAPGVSEPHVTEPEVGAEPGEPGGAEPAAAEPELDSAEADAASSDADGPESEAAESDDAVPTHEVSGGPGPEELAAELRAEHGGTRAAAEPEDKDQLTLGF